jgi:hypothetical protein
VQKYAAVEARRTPGGRMLRTVYPPPGTLRYDALQTTFSVFIDIFYPPIFVVLRRRDFFNTHAIYQQLR